MLSEDVINTSFWKKTLCGAINDYLEYLFKLKTTTGWEVRDETGFDRNDGSGRDDTRRHRRNETMEIKRDCTIQFQSSLKTQEFC